MKRKIISFILFALMLSTSFSCNAATDKTHDEFSVWLAPNTEKIYRDYDYSKAAQSADKIALSVFGGESESAQLVISAKTDISNYSVALSDLTSASGKKIGKENVSVYNQKYIYVNPTTSGYQTGYYPDALLPFETAVEYKENKVEKGDNQSVWFDYAIPLGTEAGVYTGTYTLSIDGTDHSLPVTLIVYDYELKETVNSRSLFGLHMYWNDGGIAAAEKDSSWEMFQKYYDYLLKYRVTGRNLPAATGDVEGFIVQLKNYAKDYRVTNITLPYTEKYDATYKETGIDYDEFVEYLTAIYNLSLQDNYNYFEKISTYFTMFDEAASEAKINMANHILQKCYNLQEDLADKWRADSNACSEKDNIIKGMLNVTQLFVSYYQSSFTTGATYCPILGQYNTEEGRDKYQQVYEYSDGDNYHTQNTEKWWYNAGATKNPYASYNIDTELFSPRIYSWMQHRYNVTGNLYWSASFFVKRASNANTYETLQDYYDEAVRFPPYNGDGFLLYPGAPYNIDGPVGTIRLTAIRDGLEEYDLLCDLENYAKSVSESENIGVNFDNVIDLLNSGLFSGTRVISSNENFSAARQSLAEMLVAAKRTGAVITDAINQDGSAILTVYAPNGTAFNQGEKISDTKNGALYRVEITLDKKSNAFEGVFSKDGKQYGVTIDLGGANSVTAPDQMIGNVVLYDKSSVKSVVLNEISGYSGKVLKISLAESNNIQGFEYTLASAVATGVKEITFNIYNPGQAFRATLQMVNSQSVYTPYSEVNIANGWNTITINLGSLSSITDIKSIAFDIGVKNQLNSAKTIYAASVILKS